MSVRIPMCIYSVVVIIIGFVAGDLALDGGWMGDWVDVFGAGPVCFCPSSSAAAALNES